MNKKVSTIFAMAALMGGSLFSSAYAADLTIGDVKGDPVSKNEDLLGKQVFLTVGNDVIGAYLDETDPTQIHYQVYPTAGVAKEDLNQYLWRVGQTLLPGGDYAYTFTNEVTGTLTFLKKGSSYTLT